jgi:hypothetical protein
MILPFLLATTPPDLPPLDLKQLEAELNEVAKPEEKTPLEVLVEDFDFLCEDFYGCGPTYRGVEW